MAPRAVGALFALVAAVVLLASLGAGLAPKIVPGWWDGHPRVDGKTIERKEIHVGLLAGHGCNLGETVTCQELPTGATLAPIGMGEMAAIGVTLASLIALMISAWMIGERRKWLAKLVLGETIAIALGGAVLLVLGPQIKSTQHVDVPIGLGMMLFWAGVGCASIAGVITMRLEREPLRLRASAPAVNPPPQQPAPFDFNEILREDQLHAPVPSPGGHLAGPAGPLSPMQMLPPQTAPPLPPQTAPPMPPHMFDPAPPMPQPTPQPMYDSIAPPPAPPIEALAAPPPPPRQSSPSMPPPLTGPARAKAASLPPPLAPAMPGRPARATNSPPSKFPTLAHAIPPPPTPGNLTAPTVLPARDSAVKIPVDTTERSTAVRDVPEPVTAVEIDAEAKARHAAAGKVPLPGMPSPKPVPANAPRDSSLDATVERPREPNEVAPEPRDSAATIARPRVSTPVIEGGAEPRDSAETIARPRVSAPDLDEATRQSAPIVDKPEDLGATIERNPAPPPKPAPEPEPEPPMRASQVPISTAPASLPPPRKTTTQTAGPTPACPQCEAPMAWVEEHLRFYCPQCRMYF